MHMRIGIDARLIEETGVGRYTRNLIRELGRIDKENSYVVFLRQSSFASFQPPNQRWSKRLTEVPWHTVTEQLVMPKLFRDAKLDLVHIPYHNPPIFYSGRTVVTIHDLTILHFDTGRATTLPLPLYKLRRVGYRIALTVGLRRVQKIIAVSRATKQEIMDHFRIPPEKIMVTYEGVDERVKSQESRVKSEKPLVEPPYFLYVGNAYPHKNLETLISAFKSLITHHSSPITLVLVGKEDFFYRRAKELVNKQNLNDRVIFFDEADDRQLASLYTHAIALVFPSLMEGFGLPGLEAMAHGIPVVCSDIAVFREIYQEDAVYFDPTSYSDIAAKLNNILSSKELRERLIRGGFRRIQRFSWHGLAEKTLNVYNMTAR